MPPEEQSITSTPLGFTSRARATLCAGPQPASSSTERRRKSGFAAGQWARTDSTTSMQKRMRFRSVPPYSSLRRLEKGDRNSWTR